jgi:hypothetical protein
VRGEIELAGGDFFCIGICDSAVPELREGLLAWCNMDQPPPQFPQQYAQPQPVVTNIRASPQQIPVRVWSGLSQSAPCFCCALARTAQFCCVYKVPCSTFPRWSTPSRNNNRLLSSNSSYLQHKQCSLPTRSPRRCPTFGCLRAS